MNRVELLMAEEPEPESTKAVRFDVRLTAKQKQIVEKAARALGQSLSSFVLASTLERAREVIQQEVVLELSERDWKKVQKVLANPPAPNTSLKKAMSNHRRQVRSDV